MAVHIETDCESVQGKAAQKQVNLNMILYATVDPTFAGLNGSSHPCIPVLSQAHAGQ
jgi:hypothetical protein